jgi:hypothetical protein
MLTDIEFQEKSGPVELSSTKPPSSKNRSIRKRKFLEDEPIVPVVTKRPSDMIGPFWYEKTTVEIHNNESVCHGITKREEQMLREIVDSNVFTVDKLRSVVVPLNDEKSKTPRLRAFDWAVTNFAKGNPQLLVVDGSVHDPNTDYQSALRKHHRLLFDPFRRGTHIFYEVDGVTHRTTVGQLCFIKWCLEYRIDKYVEENLVEIRNHMSTVAKTRQKKRRRTELTKSNRTLVRGVVCSNLNIV